MVGLFSTSTSHNLYSRRAPSITFIQHLHSPAPWIKAAWIRKAAQWTPTSGQTWYKGGSSSVVCAAVASSTHWSSRWAVLYSCRCSVHWDQTPPCIAECTYRIFSLTTPLSALSRVLSLLVQLAQGSYEAMEALHPGWGVLLAPPHHPRGAIL